MNLITERYKNKPWEWAPVALPKFDNYTFYSCRERLGKLLIFNYIFTRDDLFLLVDLSSDGSLTRILKTNLASKNNVVSIPFLTGSSFFIPNTQRSISPELIKEEKATNELLSCYVDAGPFFSKKTKVAFDVSDAIIVTVGASKQALKSLENILLSKKNEAIKEKIGLKIPLVQCVIMFARKKETEREVSKALDVLLDIVRRYIDVFTTKTPENHVFLVEKIQLQEDYFDSLTSMNSLPFLTEKTSAQLDFVLKTLIKSDED